ncbi:MAG: ABC transporter permease [Acidobacteria bacterium]|nr:ABC transporter permease [Acidobacteriota bacterium]
MLRDALHALRSFRQNPGFTAVVVLSIALGIAANTTVFSIVNGLLLGDLPVHEPDRLVGFAGGRSMSYPDYIDYRDQTREVFEGVSAHFPVVPASIGGDGKPERIWGQVVSGNYFSVIGVKPVLGRGVSVEEDQAAGRDAVVVLSHSLWRRRFGSDPAVAGRTVALNGQTYAVIGVAPPGFRGTDRGIVAEFWAPLAMFAQIMPDLAKGNPTQQRNNQWLMVNARLKPGVSREQALAAVAVIKNRIDETHFKGDQRRRNRPVALDKAGGLIGGTGKQAFGLMSVLMVVVGFVLLIACANVANLLLARATARQKEIAIRLSVGASRGRLVRQLLTESILLSLLGAFAGFVLAFWAASAISSFQVPFPFPIVFDFRPDLRVLAFAAALAMCTGVFFGLAPALRATRPDLLAALKNEMSVFGRVRRFGLRNALVVVQVALSLVLLTGSGLFLRSLQRASSIDIGMRPDNVLLMAMDPKLHRYSPERTQRFISQLRERVSALPGVRGVTFLDSIPLSIGGTSNAVKTETGKDGVKSVNADIYGVGSGFFKTMQLPLRRGRDFNLRTDGADVAIVNELLARELFGDTDPLGQRIASAGQKLTIIGVAGNSKSRTLGEEPRACAFLFLESKPEDVMSFYGISIAVKTVGPPRKLVRAVREQIAALDPTLAVFNTETMQEHVNKALLIPRVCAVLLAVFGGIGLTLAGIGLYGVMSYSTRRRTREFGIRMAIGAPQGSVLRMVLGQGLQVAGLGLAIGLGIALSVTRFAASLLYGISATDVVTFTAVPAVLLGVALAAILVPALRASRIDPIQALRYE